MTSDEVSLIAALQPSVVPPPGEQPAWVRRLRHRVRRAIRRRHRGRIVDDINQRQAQTPSQFASQLPCQSPCDLDRAHTAAERIWREAYINAQAQLGIF